MHSIFCLLPENNVGLRETDRISLMARTKVEKVSSLANNSFAFSPLEMRALGLWQVWALSRAV